MADFITTMYDLDAGVFAGKIDRAARDVALGTVTHGKKGKLVIELNFARVGKSNQVEVKHKIKYSRPTMNGSAAEDDETTTPMFVAGDGTCSFMPPDQPALDFGDHEKSTEEKA